MSVSQQVARSWNRLVPDVAAEGRALDELHREVGDAVRAVRPIDVSRRRAARQRWCFRAPPPPASRSSVRRRPQRSWTRRFRSRWRCLRRGLVEDLQHNGALKTRVACAVHLAHAARTEEALDDVAVDDVTGLQRHEPAWSQCSWSVRARTLDPIGPRPCIPLQRATPKAVRRAARRWMGCAVCGPKPHTHRPRPPERCVANGNHRARFSSCLPRREKRLVQFTVLIRP